MNLFMPPPQSLPSFMPVHYRSSFILNDKFYDDHLSMMSTSTVIKTGKYLTPVMGSRPMLKSTFVNNNNNYSKTNLRSKRTFSNKYYKKSNSNINNVNLDLLKSQRYMNTMNNNGYKIIEEEYINMNGGQHQRGQQYQQNGIDSFINPPLSRRQITEEHIDLTGIVSNGGDGQRRPSFKRHISIPFGLSQQDGGTQGLGLQRSLSAQNIHVDSRLAESERNLNYCVRFAVNGLSKSHMGGIPSINKNIQAGDFGDDAGMIAENSKCIVIGLADGAGGNREIGIDPKKFSRSLLGYCVEIIKNEDILPHQMSRLATKAIQYLEGRNIVGSGTLCLLSLNKETNIMSTLNLGDSGFRLVRQGKIRHKSSATMAGSSPRQVFVTECRYSGISFVDENDIGRDSDLREFRVKKGDIIVMSSDGLFDVLPDQEIERVVNAHNPKDLQGIADELLQLSMRSYLHTHRDDILVMVCRVELKKISCNH